MTGTYEQDRQQILDHIHSIFRAFLDKDRDAVRDAHAPDWVGFLGPSTQIERGLDAYMVNADMSLDNIKGVGYELMDTEVQIHGDLGIVYYIARYDYEEEGEVHSFPLRSVDIYRRESSGWIQVGSHIAVIPSGGRWGEGNTED